MSLFAGSAEALPGDHVQPHPRHRGSSYRDALARCHCHFAHLRLAPRDTFKVQCEYVYIDGTWLFYQCAPGHILANRMEFPDSRFPLDFVRLLATFRSELEQRLTGRGDDASNLETARSASTRLYSRSPMIPIRSGQISATFDGGSRLGGDLPKRR